MSVFHRHVDKVLDKVLDTSPRVAQESINALLRHQDLSQREDFSSSVKAFLYWCGNNKPAISAFDRRLDLITGAFSLTASFGCVDDLPISSTVTDVLQCLALELNGTGQQVLEEFHVQRMTVLVSHAFSKYPTLVVENPEDVFLHLICHARGFSGFSVEPYYMIALCEVYVHKLRTHLRTFSVDYQRITLRDSGNGQTLLPLIKTAEFCKEVENVLNELMHQTWDIRQLNVRNLDFSSIRSTLRTDESNPFTDLNFTSDIQQLNQHITDESALPSAYQAHLMNRVSHLLDAFRKLPGKLSLVDRDLLEKYLLRNDGQQSLRGSYANNKVLSSASSVMPIVPISTKRDLVVLFLRFTLLRAMLFTDVELKLMNENIHPEFKETELFRIQSLFQKVLDETDRIRISEKLPALNDLFMVVRKEMLLARQEYMTFPIMLPSVRDLLEKVIFMNLEKIANRVPHISGTKIGAMRQILHPLDIVFQMPLCSSRVVLDEPVDTLRTEKFSEQSMDPKLRSLLVTPPVGTDQLTSLESRHNNNMNAIYEHLKKEEKKLRNAQRYRAPYTESINAGNQHLCHDRVFTIAIENARDYMGQTTAAAWSALVAKITECNFHLPESISPEKLVGAIYANPRYIKTLLNSENGEIRQLRAIVENFIRSEGGRRKNISQPSSQRVPYVRSDFRNILPPLVYDDVFEFTLTPGTLEDLLARTAEARAELVAQGHAVTPLLGSDVDCHTRPIPNGLFLLDNVMEIDNAPDFSDAHVESVSDLANGLVPNDQTTIAFNLTEEPLFKSGFKTGATFIRLVTSQTVVNQHPIMTWRVNAISTQPKYQKPLRMDRIFVDEPSWIHRPTNWKVIPFRQPIGQDDYIKARTALWRRGYCFKAIITAPDGMKAYQLMNRKWMYHGSPFAMFNKRYNKVDAMLADHFIHNFVCYNFLVYVCNNVRVGLPTSDVPILQLLEEHPTETGVMARGNAYHFVTDVMQAKILAAVMMAEKISGLNTMLARDNKRHTVFSQRVSGFGTWNGTAIHEMLCEYSADVPTMATFRISRTGVRGRNTLTEARIAELVPSLTPAECAQLKVEYGLSNDLVCHPSADDLLDQCGANYNLLNLFSAILLVDSLERAGVPKHKLKWLEYRPILCAMPGEELLVQFPYIHLDDETRKSVTALLQLEVWPAFTEVLLVTPSQDAVRSVYPLCVEESHRAFYLENMHGYQERDLGYEIFRESAEEQEKTYRLVNGKSIVQMRVDMFCTESDIPSEMNTNFNMVGCVVNMQRCQKTEDMQEALLGVDIDVHAAAKRMTEKVSRISFDTINLPSCTDSKAPNRQACGCSLLTITNLYRCRVVFKEIVEMIPPSQITDVVFRQIGRAYMRIVDDSRDVELFMNHLSVQVFGELNAVRWNSDLAKEIRDDLQYKTITIKTCMFYAHKYSPILYDALIRRYAERYIEEHDRVGLNMERVVASCVAWMNHLSYISVNAVGGGYEFMIYKNNGWQPARAYEDSVLVKSHGNAYWLVKTRLRDAKARLAATDETDKPATKNAKERVAMWQSIENNFNTRRGERTLREMLYEIMYYEQFHEVKDGNPFLTRCIGCVLRSIPHLKRVVVESGIPEQYLTKCTNVEYVDMTMDHPHVQAILAWFRSMFVDYRRPENEREKLMYIVLSDIARGFAGQNDTKSFWILLGPSGDNAKSTLAKMIMAVFGEYAGLFKSSILTATEGDAGKASPELATLAFLRWAIAAELDKADEIRGGLLKKYTSNDPFPARPLFMAQIMVSPTARLMLHANMWPEIVNASETAYRRLRFCPCLSMYTSRAPALLEDQKMQRHYLIDPNFENKMLEWKSAMLWLLIQLYPGNEITTCPEMLEQKEAYLNDVDHIGTFFRQNMEVVDERGNQINGVVSHDAAYERFREFMHPRLGRKSVPGKDEFIAGMISAKVKSFSEHFENVRLKEQSADALAAKYRQAALRRDELNKKRKESENALERINKRVRQSEDDDGNLDPPPSRRRPQEESRKRPTDEPEAGPSTARVRVDFGKDM